MVSKKVLLSISATPLALVSALVGFSTTSEASATSGRDDNVTICHRTASYTNPYVRITVDRSAVDGDTANNHSKADHYMEHHGPVFASTLPKHIEWGDIIPPVAGHHSGYNWTSAGQAIYNNGCKPATTTPGNPGTSSNPGNNGGGATDSTSTGRTLGTTTAKLSVPTELPSTGPASMLSVLSVLVAGTYVLACVARRYSVLR